jgi:hypothetical protein
MGGDTPPENELSANEGICRQTKNNIPQNVKLNQDIVLKISRMPLKWSFMHGLAPPPPSLLGKQNKSDNIRFTVGQYWLIIKKNGTNSVNFVRNCVYFVISGKFVLCLEKRHQQPPGF